MKSYRFSFWMILLITAIIIPTLHAVADSENKLIPILCYHRVNPKIKNIFDLTPEMLEEQLQFFKENDYHPITALQYFKSQGHPEYLPDKPVVLTFDDGNKDHYQYVFPLLQQYGFQATFFIYPAMVFEKSDYFITWDELSEMVKAGMDIESHTFSHRF
jgi:poly-beta-1,6-N-acetyl-D-glucosamine N-deacetylase